MSATPNNVGLSGAVKGLPDLGGDVWNEGVSTRDALQTLLAFACIHEQARRRPNGASTSKDSKEKEEEFGLDEVLHLVAARAVSITGADGVAIALAEENAIVCRASAGRITPDPGVRLDPNSGFSGACLRSGQTVRCDDSETDVRVNAEACRTLGARSMIAVPLSAKQRVIGLIEAFSSEVYGFNDSDVRSLDLLAELILAAIRPEEEDRLAELASLVVVPDPVSPEAVEPQVLAKPPRVDVGAAETLGHETLAPAMPLTDLTGSDTASQAPAPVEARTEVAPLALVEVEPEVPKQERSFSGLALVVALTLVAIGLGLAVASKIRHVEQSISANTRSTPQGGVKTDLGEANVPAPTPLKPGATPEVTGIRHWSSAESSTVVVDLQDQVQYEAHSLDNPRRIYFDLHDTKMASGLFNKSIDVNDAFLKRVRMAQPVEGITRVVLETKGDSEFSVSLDRNPYRLTIDVHKPGTSSGAKTSPVTLSKPSPAIAVEPKKLAAPSDARLNNPTELRIVLDAGHGGWDLGTVGRKGLLEKDLVLDIVARLGKMIESKLGAQVIYTRQDDTYLPLERRAEIANLAKADLFLSVHANYSDLTTARGVETYYTNTYSSVKARTADDNPLLKEVNWTGVDIRAKVIDSHRFAADVQQALFGGLVARNPEIRNRGVKAAQYVVLTGTQMPAVLAEVSFVSSPADEDQLQSSEYRQEIAEALYRGVAKYKAAVKHPKVANLAKSAD